MSNASEALARQIADLQRRLAAIERTAQLTHSSVEDDEGNSVSVGGTILHASALAAEALAAAADAQARVDGMVTTFYGEEEPIDPAEVGDLWLREPDNVLHRFDGETWTVAQDQSIAEAIDAAQNAQDTADGKIVSYWQSGPPALPLQSPRDGDLWFDTDNDNAVSRYETNFSPNEADWAWVALPVGTAGIAAELAGKTITGGLIRTAATGSRVELDEDGGLAAYAADGVTANFRIFNRDEIENPTAPFTGAKLGRDAALRLEGASALDGAIGKRNAGDALQIRAAIDVLNGAGINLYENVDTSGADGDGDGYNGSLRFYTNQLQTLKLLKNGDAVFRAGIRAAAMRPTTAIGGASTLRSVDTFAPVTGGPLLTFTAPPSGCVTVDLTIFLRSTDITAQAQAGIELRTGLAAGGGAQIVAPSGVVANGNLGWVRTGGRILVQGLAPGSSHNVRAMFRSETAAKDVYASEHILLVTPCL